MEFLFPYLKGIGSAMFLSLARRISGPFLFSWTFEQIGN